MAGSRSKREYGRPEPPPVPGARHVDCGDGVFAIVDEGDWDVVRPLTWFLNDRGVPMATYPAGDGTHTSIQLKAAVLMERMTAGFCIANLDGNPLDCRRANLRKMTLKELRALSKRLDDAASVVQPRKKYENVNGRLERPSVVEGRRARREGEKGGAEKSVLEGLGEKS